MKKQRFSASWTPTTEKTHKVNHVNALLDTWQRESVGKGLIKYLVIDNREIVLMVSSGLTDLQSSYAVHHPEEYNLIQLDELIKELTEVIKMAKEY